MSMQTMNPNAGGPVGGMIMMNNGSPAVSVGMNSDAKSNLNAYIYDYLLKNEHYESARQLANDPKFDFPRGQKLSPGRRKDADMNGDTDMDMDKDDAPDDLPRPHNWTGTSGSAFLFEWFNIFMDLFQVHSSKNAGGRGHTQAAQYLIHEKNNQRQREMAQNQNLARNPLNNAAIMQRMQGMQGMANGKMPPGMSQQQQMAVMQQKRQQAAMALQQQQMRGDQPDAEMNGVRPGTPAEGDAVGSPSKRPRIENGQQNFQPGMMPNNRPAAVPAGPNGQMLMQSSFNPAMAQQFRNGQMPQKPMQVPNPMMNAGSPMMAGMNQYNENMNMDMSYNRQNMPSQQQMPGGPQSGNHALQDYQMQLMLLEQQNKKRLMMARQEQHENNPNATGLPGVGMPGGLSPSGSRTGSPSANEGLNGRSPAAMNFMGNMQGADFNPGMFMKDQPMMAPGPQMRPPTSNEMNMRQPGGRPFPPGGQPMQQQNSQTGPQMGTPGQRSDMPPPSAPATGGQQRNNGNSPNGNAPPTPSQTAKANPKGKKGAAKEEAKRQRPNKKGSTANAPASDDNPPATPQPSTPITPNNPGAMNNGNKGQQGMQPGNQHQPNQGMPMNQQMPSTDFQMDFNGSGPGGEPFNLDFSTLENADVLENFDFDSFLNTSADNDFNFGEADLGATFGMGDGE